MTQWKKVLKSLGFSESESVIYLTSLEMGPGSVQDLAKKAKVSRVTTYAVIESLSERGLMSSVEKGKKRLFVAESPERLVTFVHARVREMQATLKEVESSMQDLRLMQRGERPIVKMFEGKEALKAIQDDVLKTRPKSVDEFGNLDEILKVHSRDELQPFYSEMAKFKPRTRGVMLAKSEEIKPGNKDDQIVRLSCEDHDFGGDVLVYGSKVALSTFRGKQISVLIESEEIAQTMRAMFDHIWSCQK